MNSNEWDLPTKIISIVSLVILGYIFFISVYYQIIVQSGGLFFVIIFCGILVLAFVMLSLVTKLIEISKDIKDNFMWSFVEILLLCHLSFLFLIYRLAYTTSLPAEDTIIYRAADLMREGTLATAGMDMFRHLIVYPSEYICAVLYSVFLRITGKGPESLVIFNSIVLILIAFMIDRIVRKVAGRTCGIVAALCTLFVPSQSFAIYTYSSEFLFCLILVVSLDLFLILLNLNDEDKNRVIGYSALFGLVLSLLLFTEPLSLIIVIIYFVYFILYKKKNDLSPIRSVAIALGCLAFIFVILVFLKSNSLETDIGEVISGSMSRFKFSRDIETGDKFTFGEVFSEFHSNLDNKNSNVSDNYNFLVNKEGESYTQTHNAWFSLGTQMSYMFVIVMSIACAFYIFRNKFREAVPCLLFMFGCFIMLFFRSTNEQSTYFMFEVLIVIAGCGLNYMYRNHHPEFERVAIAAEVPASELTSTDNGAADWKAISRARALIFTGANEQQPTANAGMMNDSSGAFTGSVFAGTPETVQPAQPAPVVSPVPTPVPTPAPAPKPAPKPVMSMQDNNPYTGATISPEGYFSFFSEEPQYAEPEPVSQYTEPAPEPVQQFEESVQAEPLYEEPKPAFEDQSGMQAVSEELYEGPIQEFDEPEDINVTPEEFIDEDEALYEGPIQEFEEITEDEPVMPVSEQAKAEPEPEQEYVMPEMTYMDPEESNVFGESDEYDDEPLPPSHIFGRLMDEVPQKNEEPAYEEPAPVYEEPMQENDAGMTFDEGMPEDIGQLFGESVQEAETPAAEINEPEMPVYSEQQIPVNAEPGVYYAKNTSNPDPEAKSSYGAAAHALGFSFGNGMFGDFGNDNSGQFEDGLDEFSFGEGMPDLSTLDQPANVQGSDEAAVRKKKVIKKKIVRKVVKKSASPLPGIKLDEIDLGAAFDEANKKYNNSDDNGDGSDGGYVIEI
ncbi:MAG: hypothetical protein IKS84_02935 [Lachnospiraceae bacterium]|nr:hypothetical protein [Lachnospiraceae bacterium]